MKLDPLEYVLNRMERAAQSDEPAKNGYGQARRELLQGIADLRQQNAALVEALEKLVTQCGEVSPFSGNDVSVRSVRQAGKFMDAVKQARAALALARGEK